MKLCQCGCGRELDKQNIRFIYTHHLRGKSNPMYGKHHSKETKNKISQKHIKFRIKKSYLKELYWNKKLSTSQIGKIFNANSETIRLKMIRFGIKRRESSLGNLGKHFSEEHRRKISQTRILRALSKGDKNPMSKPEIIKKYFKSIRKRPTLPEKIMMTFCKKYGLPFVYNGNKASLIIGRRVPDFYNNKGKRQVIEIFGEIFHDSRKSFVNIPFRRTEQGTIEHYKGAGYNCLIIWSRELRNPQQVLQKIKAFSESN